MVSRTGVAEIPTDPMGVETSDIYVILKDHAEWTTARDSRGADREVQREALEAEVPAMSSATRSPSSCACRS